MSATHPRILCAREGRAGWSRRAPVATCCAAEDPTTTATGPSRLGLASLSFKYRPTGGSFVPVPARRPALELEEIEQLTRASYEEAAAGGAMADLNAAAQFALCVALGVSYILKPLLDFLDGVNKPLSPVLEFAVAVLISTLPLAYLMGILLLQLQVAPAPAPGAPAVPPPAPGAARRLACFACTMVSPVLALLAVALIGFWFLTGGSPP